MIDGRTDCAADDSIPLRMSESSLGVGGTDVSSMATTSPRALSDIFTISKWGSVTDLQTKFPPPEPSFMTYGAGNRVCVAVALGFYMQLCIREVFPSSRYLLWNNIHL